MSRAAAGPGSGVAPGAKMLMPYTEAPLEPTMEPATFTIGFPGGFKFTSDGDGPYEVAAKAGVSVPPPTVPLPVATGPSMFYFSASASESDAPASYRAAEASSPSFFGGLFGGGGATATTGATSQPGGGSGGGDNFVRDGPGSSFVSAGVGLDRTDFHGQSMNYLASYNQPSYSVTRDATLGKKRKTSETSKWCCA